MRWDSRYPREIGLGLQRVRLALDTGCLGPQKSILEDQQIEVG
jgi:hypothetical protein